MEKNIYYALCFGLLIIIGVFLVPFINQDATNWAAFVIPLIIVSGITGVIVTLLWKK